MWLCLNKPKLESDLKNIQTLIWSYFNESILSWIVICFPTGKIIVVPDTGSSIILESRLKTSLTRSCDITDSGLPSAKAEWPLQSLAH